MGFQTTVHKDLAVAIPGELFRNDPSVAFTKVLESDSVGIGCVVTQSTTVEDQCVTGGAGIILGIVANPKEYSNFTDFGVSFALAKESNVDIVSKGTISVVTSTAVDIKDKAKKIYFNDTTGVLGQADAVPDGSTELTGARFVHTDVASAGGIAVLQLEVL